MTGHPANRKFRSGAIPAGAARPEATLPPSACSRAILPLVLVVALSLTACSTEESGRGGAASGKGTGQAGVQGPGPADRPGGGSGPTASERKKANRVARRSRREAKRSKERLAVPAGGGDRDCADFPNQAAAQRAMAGGDPYGLDGDGDGVACTALPCPCSRAAAGTGAGGSGASPAGPAGGGGVAGHRSFRARVVSVTDGDTLDVQAAGIGTETIRLIGIDTPEVYGGVECGGRAASNEMKRLATGTVTIRPDPTQDLRDRYGRLLAYVDKAGRDLGRVMVARGFAPAYVYDAVFRRYPAYRKAENRARAAKRGSWRHCNIGK